MPENPNTLASPVPQPTLTEIAELLVIQINQAAALQLMLQNNRITSAVEQQILDIGAAIPSFNRAAAIWSRFVLPAQQAAGEKPKQPAGFGQVP